MHRPDASPGSADSGGMRWLLLAATAVSFLLVIQNFGLDILPDRRIHIAPDRIRPYSQARTFAYVFDYSGSEPDLWPSDRSRVRLYEDGHEYPSRVHQTDAVVQAGGGMFAHEPGRIVFASTDNTDPRSNGRSYDLAAPVLYRESIGDAAVLALLSCVAALYSLARRPGPAAAAARTGPSRWPWHLAGAGALFALGLYCNTGTLAPYANTTFPVVSQSTGYAYNPDHVHFRVLFDFVDGRGRAVWDKAILLRRILFPVLGWPLMKVLGFELGGTLTALALNIAGFFAGLALLRRGIGERGAVLAAWLVALYPGAAFWAGLPYSYALIFPGSLLLALGLVRLSAPTTWRGLAAVSLAMGVAYLGYDLAIIFVPATLVVLVWRRRIAAAAASVAIQLAPLAAWIFALVHFFHQPLKNGNSGIYLSVIKSLLHSAGAAPWWRQLARGLGDGCDTFFASNFIFIPGLFLLAVVLNPLTSRIRFRLAEVAILAAGLAVFLVLNLAPGETGGWEMRGTWISRLYQPVFPALVFFIARWWQGLPPLSRPLRLLVVSALAATTLGDALVVFGPILDNPLRISETAFYRFYDHTDAHFFYEKNLRELGRRPLGFPRKVPGLTEKEIWDQREQQLNSAVRALQNVRSSVGANRAALAGVRRDYVVVGRALADARSQLFARQLEGLRMKGEITADEARRRAKTADDFMGPALRAALGDRSLDESPKQAAAKVPGGLADIQAAIVAESDRLKGIQRDILQTQDELTAAIAELGKVREELKRPAAPAPVKAGH